MGIHTRRSLDGNLCNGCRYHSYRRYTGGNEMHTCTWGHPALKVLHGAIAECTEFFPESMKHLNDIRDLAWIADLTKGKAGFVKPGGDQ